MESIFVHAAYNRSGRPEFVEISTKAVIKRIDLFLAGSKAKLKEVFDKIDKLKGFIDSALAKNIRVGYDDVRTARLFQISNVQLCYYFEDGCKPDGDADFNRYRHLMARCINAYETINQRGIFINHKRMSPVFSLETFTSRTKCSVFDLQNYPHHDCVSHDRNDESSVYLQLDWISADVRMAGLLSGDEGLINCFSDSDPYQYMADRANEFDEVLTREQCKIRLLKSINSLNGHDVIVKSCFPGLSNWILDVSHRLMLPDSVFYTILGRAYKQIADRSKNAIMNAMLQGSVAHGMHNVIAKVQHDFPTYFICDMHDSVVLSVPNHVGVLNEVIDKVARIMVNPFNGILPDDPSFPVRVNVGKKWKKWKPYKIIRGYADDFAQDPDEAPEA